jgi:hypothetical protein
MTTNAALYIEMLLTALARGHAASVLLTAGEPLPDPATLTSDPRDLAWLASTDLELAAVPAEKIINLLLEEAGIRRFHLRRMEGRIRATLEAHDGGSAAFEFAVAKRAGDDGRARLEITPQRG